MKKHVLIVDDDKMIQMMVSYLTRQGLDLRTSQVDNAQEMNRILKNDKVDLLVLDLTLPDEDGLVLARQVRSRSDVPILVLTGDEKQETLIAALELGVDDFVRKPFDPYELQLRIRNIIMRSQRISRPVTPEQKTKFIFGHYVLYTDKRSLFDTLRDQEIHLSYNEFNILNALVRAKGRAVSRGALLDAVAQGPDGPSERAIDVYIRQLRKKMESVSVSDSVIQSVRGYGYKIPY